MRVHIFIRMLTLAVVAIIPVVRCDQCENPSEAVLASHMSTGSSPKGGIKAGKYAQVTGVKIFTDCVKACCDDPRCNSAFFTKEKKCLTIQCVSDDACSSGRKSKILGSAILIRLRTTAETSGAAKPKAVSGEKKSGHTVVSCEIGLLGCHPNEECRVGSKDHTRAKNGVCQCRKSYVRHAVTGVCSQVSTNGSVTSTSQTPASTTVAAKTTTHEVTTHQPAPIVTTKTLSTVPKIIKLTVSAGEDKVLSYPENAVKLTAFALPAPASGETYTYHWSLPKTPAGQDIGHSKGIDKQTLELSQLVSGFYVVKVEVKGKNKEGSVFVNVTVVPEQKVNEAPVAVINPAALVVKEDTTGILDGTDSTDDKKVTSYLWEIVGGPITKKLENNAGSMVKLKDLSHGKYSVRLTVTDAEGLKNSTVATVNVLEAVDYPPKANAGGDRIVHLPENSVNLYGNASSDDKKITSYEWKSKAGDVSADTKGVHEPILHLAHLRKGDYTYELVVTDSKGQKSSDEVHVYVKPSHNKPPVAMVMLNTTTVTPGSPVVLDGSPSSDDQRITKYQWKQDSGPNGAKVDNADREKANVAGLVKGDYVFQLTVFDAEDLHSSTTVDVKVRTHSNQRPVARAGGDRDVVLPKDILMVDGSKSTDDGGKLLYHWTKSDESPAAGEIINGSDRRAVMLLTNFVPGVYSFKLSVTDGEGVEASDSITVNVKPDPELLNVVEISLDTSIEFVTEKHKKNFATQLALMLPSQVHLTETKVDIVGIYPDYHSGKSTVLFLVRDAESSTQSTIRNGTVVKTQLKEKLDRDSELLGFRVAQVDTVICQNECSGHGQCDQFTKKCVCEPFWMPNYAVATWNGESNCDWSILYVVVTVLASVLLLSILIWLCVCCTRSHSQLLFCSCDRCKRTRGRRKHTYKLLQDIEEMENEEKLAKKKRSNITAGSGTIFLSETDLSSEEDTLFANGDSRNGHNLNKPSDNFVKANNLKNKLRA